MAEQGSLQSPLLPTSGADWEDASHQDRYGLGDEWYKTGLSGNETAQIRPRGRSRNGSTRSQHSSSFFSTILGSGSRADLGGDEEYDVVGRGAVSNLPREGLQFLSPKKLASVYFKHAAVLLHEGTLNLKFRFHPLNRAQMRAFRWLYNSKWSWPLRMEVAIALVFLFMTIFEHPASVDLPHRRVILPIVEIACLGILAFMLYQRAVAAGGIMIWLRQTSHVMRCVLILAVFIDIVVEFATVYRIRPIRMVRRQPVAAAALIGRLTACTAASRSVRFSSWTPSTLPALGACYSRRFTPRPKCWTWWCCSLPTYCCGAL